jgi:hypothetical protein
MRRTVTGIVLATVLLLPESGLAAARQSLNPTPLSLWEGIVEWTGRLIGSVARGTMGDRTAPGTVDGGNRLPSNPLPKNGTTTDANG